MGYGLPAAIGAKFAAPGTEVVCIDGDGSFLMTCQELAVAVREDLAITVVVLNNASVGMVRQWQDAFFDERHVASEPLDACIRHAGGGVRRSWFPHQHIRGDRHGALGRG